MAEVTYYELNNELNIPSNDGKIQLDKDKEAVKVYFIEHVNQNTVFFHTLKEKLHYLVENNYIDDKVLGKYSFEFIKTLFKSIYDKKFRFDSFMGAYKFYRQYALKTNDNSRYLERYEDRIAFNALLMGDGDEQLALDLADEMIHRRYQPATPTYANAGKKRRGEFVSCFLLQTTDDMNSIGRTINSALQLSKRGGGVGITLSNLRENTAPIKEIEGAASGVVPVMKLFEDSFKYSNQLGQRQGAGVVYLNVFHPDIIDFLATRKENADEAVRIKMLSLGVIVPDKYYELVKNDEYMHLFSPYDVEREYGVPFSYVDITKEYENMLGNPKIRKTTIKARDLDEEIGKLQQESGYPYILNIDTANRANPAGGKIIMSNLCSEILQTQTPSVLNPDLSYNELGKDISCNLGSINIPNQMKSPDFGKSIAKMVDALTYITDDTNIEEVPTVKNGNDKYHTIGLGFMGFHTFLATHQIEYGSPLSIEFIDLFAMLVNYYSLKESTKIAQRKGEVFEGFEDSKYATGEYFDKYTDDELATTYSNDVLELFKGIDIPGKEDWEALKQEVMANGIYNKYRQAVAPTGSISYVNETSSSLQPIISLVEKRQEGKTGATYYPAPGLSNESLPYYKSAYDLSMLKVIDVYAAAQKHIDQGMSLTLFMRSTIPAGMYPWKPEGGKLTTKDLSLIRYYAFQKGIKTLYYVRTYTDDDTEIGINECESCSI